MPDGDLRKELDALRSDIASMRADLGRITDTIRRSAGESVQDTGESMRHRVDELQRRIQAQMHQVFDTARARSKLSLEDMEQRIEERPFLSMLIAFGIGLIVSQLLSRR